MKSRRNLTREFKVGVLRELEGGKPAAEICREYNINSSQLYKWRRQLREYPKTAFSGNGKAYTYEAKLAEKDRLIGKLYAENELLKKAIASLREHAAELRKR